MNEPKAFDKLVKKLKKHPGKIDNPYALAHYIQKKKGKECGDGLTDKQIEELYASFKDEQIKKKDKETNDSSAAGQLFRKGKKDGIKESNQKIKFNARFIEAEVNDSAREVPVIIIQEGLGNKRDLHFYTKEALGKSYQRFDGAQCYADHPSRSEESDRPERSIKDIVGYYRNPELIDYNGKAAIKATLKIFGGDAYAWAWDLVKEAIAFGKEYPDKDLVGISINANGVTHEGQDEQDNIIHYVDDITEVFSSDIVTKAGAGGKVGAGLKEAVKKFIEAKAKGQGGKKLMKNALKKTVEEMEALKAKCESGEVEGGALPTAIDEIISQLKALVDKAPEEDGETAEAEKKAKEEAEKKAKEEAEKKAKEEAEDEDDSDVDADGKKKMAEVVAENKMLKEQMKLVESRDMVTKLLKESHLPAGTYNDLVEVLVGKDEKYCKKLIEARKAFLSTILKAKVDGNGEVHIAEGAAEKPAAKAFEGLPRVETKK